MKNLIIIVLFSILAPLYCFAHGEGVLVLLSSEIFILMAFILSLIFIKLKLSQKGILLVIFVITEIITYKIIEFMPYFNNTWLINLVIILSPIFIVGFSYLILYNKNNKK